MSSLKSLIAAAALSCIAMMAQAQVVTIATNPQGSFYYSVGAAIAGLLQEKGGVSARVQPMSGSTGYTPLVNRGNIEFGLLNSSDIGYAYTGTETFKGHPNTDIRLVGALFPIKVGITVANDSPYKSIKDLKGARMPSNFTSQSVIAITQNAMLAMGGLSIDDMKRFPVSDYTKGMQALGEGKIDAAQFCLGCGTAQEANVALASRGGLRFLPLPDGPESLAEMRKVFPTGYTEVFKPAPNAPGVLVPTRGMVFSGFMITSKHVSNDLVYKATKLIYENKPSLANASPMMRGFDPKMMDEASSVPYHPGAEKFYREVGEWPPKKR
ncbi:MAG: TAXI family TRAP transporter solute-binding subunit [Betaproteobacteria bacterium]|nr:TAXI family TRAP transporter solute-binding subunit [Betaproteobacteria bacterium]